MQKMGILIILYRWIEDENEFINNMSGILNNIKEYEENMIKYVFR